MPAQRTPQPLARRLVPGLALAWLLLALVAVPALGRLHGLAHPEPPRAAPAQPPATALHDAPAGWLHHLLPDHTAADCQLLDQLALAEAAPTAPQTAPLPERCTQAVLLLTPGTSPRHVAQFQARGPPQHG